jgi:hypothetical protein
MASPTSAIHRTGPHPIAFDYSKTLLQALAEDGALPIGSVSRVQLLLTCLVERVHDAIYVLPRNANGSEVDPEEYARDVATALKTLKSAVHDLPDDTADVMSEVESLNLRLSELRTENFRMRENAKRMQEKISKRLEEL